MAMPAEAGRAGPTGGHATMAKTTGAWPVARNLPDYAATRRSCDWARARAMPDGLPNGGLNIAHEAVDRHATGPRAAREAPRWIGRRGDRRRFTWRELRTATNRVANALRAIGLQEGDRVFVLGGRIPERYLTVLGVLKAECVVSPLFSDLGLEKIATRLELGEARALVTTEALHARKVAVAGLRERHPKPENVILVGEDGAAADVPGTRAWSRLTAEAAEDFAIPPRHPGTWPCCTSPAAPPAARRARCMCTRRWRCTR